jgi:hypothetical protein
MSIIRNCAVGLVIGIIILLNPVAASLIVVSAEIVADLVAQAGVPAMLDLLIAGAIGCLVFPKSLPNFGAPPQQPRPEQAPDKTAIAT